jgi:hypothetical protein
MHSWQTGLDDLCLKSSGQPASRPAQASAVAGMRANVSVVRLR